MPAARPRGRRPHGHVRDDAGFGLVEALVAIVLLAIVMVPVTRVIVGGATAAATLQRRAEAADLASAALAKVRYETTAADQVTQGTTTTTASSGGHGFTVAVDVEPVGTPVLCTSGGTPQAFSATATVTWGAGATGTGGTAGGGHVSQSTVIPPPTTETSATDGGGIAIPVHLAADPATLETTTPLAITVTGCGPDSCNAPAGIANLVTTETQSTGTAGCAVFSGLYAGAGWTYTATVTASAGYVDTAEDATATGAPGLASLAAPIAVSPGVVATPPAGFFLDRGAPIAVDFAVRPFGGAAGTLSGVAPAPFLPVTVQAAAGPCDRGCVLGDGTAAFAGNGGQSMLLDPVLAAGADYEAWAGGPAASPSLAANSGTPAGPAGTPTALATSSDTAVTLPLFPLAVELTGTAATTTALGATPLGSTASLTLALPTTPASPTGGSGSGSGGGGSTSSSGLLGAVTGLPLGQYQLSAPGAGGLSGPTYVWITLRGVCAGRAPLTACTAPSSAPVGPFTVGS